MAQPVVAALLAAITLLAVVKIGDQVALMVLMTRSTRPDLDSPAFSLFKRRAEDGSRLSAAARFIGDGLFRAPAIVVAGAVGLVCAGSRFGDLQALVGCLMILVADNIVLVALLAIIRKRRHDLDPYGRSGFHGRRTYSGVRDVANALDPILVISMTTMAIILAYAMAYRGLYVAHDNSFYSNGAPYSLSLVDALYFSVVVGGTVGFGDLVPHSTAAKLVVSTHIFMVVVAFSLFAGYFVRDRRPTRS